MIRSISGDMPHQDYGSWERFLETCELRAEADGVKHYGRTNCNYLVFPTGELIKNYGFHGQAVMNRIRDNGWQVVLEDIKDHCAYIRSLIAGAK
jgi:hypothetical protein